MPKTTDWVKELGYYNDPDGEKLRVLVYGEDVAGGKGGVFTVTRNLTAEFGESRCFNAPLAENSIIGTAAGLAVGGFRPVIEIQFAPSFLPEVNTWVKPE